MSIEFWKVKRKAPFWQNFKVIAIYPSSVGLRNLAVFLSIHGVVWGGGSGVVDYKRFSICAYAKIIL